MLGRVGIRWVGVGLVAATSLRGRGGGVGWTTRTYKYLFYYCHQITFLRRTDT